MKTKEELINEILAEWNPIEIDSNVVYTEYKIYIPDIIQHINDENKLFYYLENILINNMELPYDRSNYKHVNDLKAICKRLYSI